MEYSNNREIARNAWIAAKEELRRRGFLLQYEAAAMLGYKATTQITALEKKGRFPLRVPYGSAYYPKDIPRLGGMIIYREADVRRFCERRAPSYEARAASCRKRLDAAVKMLHEKGFMLQNEAAKVMGVSRNSIARMEIAGSFPRRVLRESGDYPTEALRGMGTCAIYRKSDVEKFMNKTGCTPLPVAPALPVPQPPAPTLPAPAKEVPPPPQAEPAGFDAFMEYFDEAAFFVVKNAMQQVERCPRERRIGWLMFAAFVEESLQKLRARLCDEGEELADGADETGEVADD